MIIYMNKKFFCITKNIYIYFFQICTQYQRYQQGGISPPLSMLLIMVPMRTSDQLESNPSSVTGPLLKYNSIRLTMPGYYSQ